ncbi:MAG: hypothetical protein JWQ90_3355 [Hydrocarboniphaga sp.]|uniref:DUF2884 family protein n=1 Tax=Hydrocarboniphaga sp. TaxID=2033016 RepID=UPI0026126F6D|nr:DUF2884 family protein [Hydrocarboniphaga sp.]MDB5970905.1 hypothetical protein [Hydrocarboniphaga sp.]
MRISALLPATLLLFGFCASAQAGPSTLCNYQMKYDIEIDGDGAHLRNARTAPDIDIAGDRLWIDGKERALSTIERRRLLDYRRELTGFTRDVSRVALEGAQLGIEAAVLAISTLAGDDDGGTKLLSRFDGLRSKLAQQFDGRHLPAQALGKDYDKELDETIDQITEEAVAEISSSVAKLVAMSLFAPSLMEARAEHVEQLVDTHVEQRGNHLERDADALCGQLRRLDALENALNYFDAFDRDAPSI